MSAHGSIGRKSEKKVKKKIPKRKKKNKKQKTEYWLARKHNQKVAGSKSWGGKEVNISLGHRLHYVIPFTLKIKSGLFNQEIDTTLNRQTDRCRQTDRQREKQTDWKTKRQTYRQTDRLRYKLKEI